MQLVSNMPRSVKVKIVGLIAAVVLVAALVGVASGATGAYFTDTKAGVASGTIGSIKVGTSGGSGGYGLDIAFSNLLPGEPQTISANYQNTGRNNQDVWIVFNNATALSALNNLGTYGEVTVSDSNTGDLFYSNNLNDYPNNGGVTPLPEKIKLVSNLGPGGSGTMSFTFSYAGVMTGGNLDTAPAWNSYPVPVGSTVDSRNAEGYGQKTVKLTDGIGSGLPYQIVATQVGQTP